MSSVDIKACVNELKELRKGRVSKIYHYPPNEIRIKVHKLGRKDIVIEAGKRIHLTKYIKETEKFPTGFAMALRKHLEGGWLKDVKQYYFDRIVILEFEKDEKKYLIAEIFLKGNIILLDKDFNVIIALREYKPGAQYFFPVQKINLLDLSYDDFVKLIRSENKEIVKVLASDLRLGRVYAEELCLRANINKKTPSNKVKEEDLKKIFKNLRKIIENINENKIKPNIVLENHEPIDVQPLELIFYKDFNKKYFERFNDALDEFYLKTVREKVDEEKLKLERRLQIQLETKERFEKEAELYKKAADLIYENYAILQDAINLIKNGESAEIILKFLAKHGFKAKIKGNHLMIFFESHTIKIDPSESLHEVAGRLYEESKKIKTKLSRLLEAIKDTEEKLKVVRPKLPRISIARKKEWFERFRWFVTSDGFLVIGGRNAKMNRELVSKYLEKNDLFLHTQSPGGPVTILKNGQNAPKTSIVEAAQFAASYSALWKEGKFGGEVYYVKPEQVKRAAKAGEYLPKGSFYILGKRNYLDVQLSCAIGVELSKFRVIGGPASAIKKNSDYFVEIEIGNKTPNELAEEISAMIINMASDEEKHVVKLIAKPNEIAKFIPPGKSKIKPKD